MAGLELKDDELKALEQLLARVAQLSNSIQSLKTDILKSNPLPSHSSLQASAQILQRNLQTVLDCMNENKDLFNRTAIHPSTNYPGRTQENILLQLVRKKVEPNVEELLSQAREAADAVGPEGIANLQKLWEELREWTHGRIAEYVREEAGDVYTKEERDIGVENVRTGLRKNLDDDDEDEEFEDDEDTKMEQDLSQAPQQPPLQSSRARGPELETLLWFAARGDFELPPNIEYERKVDVYKGFQGVRIPEPRPQEFPS
ncbi:hypothetical protein S40293_02338 [Stachybotrys chartarum IBT 40293]|nr:hypothetical protein S40293_02338 [Stachybotrys chartarum IBT 40293]